MAGHSLSVKYTDSSGSSTTEVVHFPSARTLAQLQGWADTAIPHLDDVTALKISEVEVRMTLNPATWDLKASPVAGYKISSGGLLSFITDDATPVSQYIPGVLDTFTSGGALGVSGALEDYRDDLLTGVNVGGTDVIASARNESPLDTFRRAKLSDRDKL